MDEPACQGCRALLKRVAELEARVAGLSRRLADALRSSKRQAAPFRKGPPKPDPKAPGRKAGGEHGRHGHRPPPPPDQVSACYEATLPGDCPHCRGPLVESGVADQFQTEIPRQPIVRRFRVHIGHCAHCGQRVQGRHPLQTSDGLGAASQVGPDAQAAATGLHTQLGLSHGKVAAVFDSLFGIDLTRGATAQINLRAAARLEPDYQVILDEVRASERLAADETGWRIGGQPAWLHVWVGDRATAYGIDSQRGAAVLERVLGSDWEGVLSHDGWASYSACFPEAIHQQCLGHALRRARELSETATRGAVRFPRQVIALFTEAIHWRHRYLRGEVSAPQWEGLRGEFDERLLALAEPVRPTAANERLAKHLWNHNEQWFSFLTDPHIEATNWQAEQAIRPAVVNRKVWGGNRTPVGAQAQGMLMSVLETCRRLAHAAVDYLSQTLRSFGHGLLPRPVLLPTR